MQIVLSKDSVELGKKAAELTASIINDAIAKKGEARIILSTGASQFTMFEALVTLDVDWSKVTMFHLDEYVNLPLTHPASFVKYLTERFVNKLPMALKEVNFVDTTDGVEHIIDKLTKKLNEAPIDLGLIGIGENGHIAFNDPPADFDTDAAYKVVNLDEACRKQQLGEGWFPTFDDVPKQAISMTVKQIMKCEKIISAVPYKVKANAVYKTLENDLTNMIPATMLKQHQCAYMFIDADSASLIDTAKYGL